MSQESQNRKLSNDVIQTGFRNVVKCSSGKAESFEHRLAKFLIADFCWQNSIEFATEVTFKGEYGKTSFGRGDIVIYDWALCVEVLHNEPIERFLKKEYPIPKMAVVPMEVILLWEMMKDLQSMCGQNHEFYTKKTMMKLKYGRKNDEDL